MAKVSFTKLGLKANQEFKTFNFNEQVIEVKQYLPVNEKLALISNVINQSIDENNFNNPLQVKVFTLLEIVYNYTNINFTDKQKEDSAKLFDMLYSSGFIAEVLDNIPNKEYDEIIEYTNKSIKAYYDYKNSVMGILENISADYSNLNLDATEIQKKLGDPENMALLKDVLTKLG